MEQLNHNIEQLPNKSPKLALLLGNSFYTLKSVKTETRSE